MNLYLDDDSAAAILVKLLVGAGHDVRTSADEGMAGENDPVHLAHAVREGRILLTHNHEDFKELHELVKASAGHHPGIFVVRRDNDPTRDMTPNGIVRAIRNLEASGVPIPDDLHILNHWR